jgi:small-conductance mechanosensitive channel
MLIGAVAGYWVARRRMPLATKRQTANRALFAGVTFPLVTCAVLLLVRWTPYGAVAGIVPKLALSVFVSLTIIRAVARTLRKLAPDSSPVRGLINTVSVMVWIGVVLHLGGGLPIVTQELESIVIPLGKTQASALTLLQGVVLVGFTLLAALWLSSTLESRLMATSVDMSLRLVLSRVIRAGLFALALLVALAAVGIDLTVLSVFGGALGVGLGLGLQRIAANYVSGFAMLLERSFRVGDSVKIDNFEGQINRINTRYTVVRAPNGRESVVPNEMFIVNRVENLSLERRGVAFSTRLRVRFDTDVEHARALMLSVVINEPRVLKDPAPTAMLSEFLTDGLELTLAYWIADPENGINNVRADLNLAIWRVFRDNNISLSAT